MSRKRAREPSLQKNKFTHKNWQTFVASVENIIREFGKNYVINFV
jgi:hypothetical protein